MIVWFCSVSIERTASESVLRSVTVISETAKDKPGLNPHDRNSLHGKLLKDVSRFLMSKLLRCRSCIYEVLVSHIDLGAIQLDTTT